MKKYCPHNNIYRRRCQIPLFTTWKILGKQTKGTYKHVEKQVEALKSLESSDRGEDEKIKKLSS